MGGRTCPPDCTCRRHLPHKAWNRKSLEELLASHRRGSTSRIARRLIADGVFENRCAICSLDPVWQGKPLTLVLDHVNGPDNWNLENLRLLCPNCHTQTPNYGGRAKRLNRRVPV